MLGRTLDEMSTGVLTKIKGSKLHLAAKHDARMDNDNSRLQSGQCEACNFGYSLRTVVQLFRLGRLPLEIPGVCWPGLFG